MLRRFRLLSIIIILLHICINILSRDYLSRDSCTISISQDSMRINPIRGKQWVKRVNDNLYISSKLDAETDIMYWFKKCMFNELFTFYRVAITPNKDLLPIQEQKDIPMTMLNLAYSDNIGPFNIAQGGWSGGNHSYNDKLNTADCVDYQIFIDGVELKSDTATWANNIEIRVVNNLLNTANPSGKEQDISLNEIFCIEVVSYKINGNSIQVEAALEYRNEKPVVVSRYCGMQSMFEGETRILTPDGQYQKWTPISEVSKFTKGEYPLFQRFIEKKDKAYQASFLMKEGLGDHTEIAEDNFIFIGNSSKKNYHKLIAGAQRKLGDKDYWRGVYTWFSKAIQDDDTIFCYSGIIDGKDAVFIDCLDACDVRITLPAKYENRKFSIYEKALDMNIINENISSKIRVSSKSSGSCILIFAD